MKRIALIVAMAALGACAPLPKCKDVVQPDGSLIEVCVKRVCRDVQKGKFVDCPEVRP